MIKSRKTGRGWKWLRRKEAILWLNEGDTLGSKKVKDMPEVDNKTRTIRLLHVDDNEDDLLITKRYLQKETPILEICDATTGAEALEKIRESEFDCIVADFEMPEMNGLKLLSVLRKQGSDIPFIFLTGQGNEQVAAEALRGGANDYFTKEIEFAHFPRLVNSVVQNVENYRKKLEQRRMEQELRENEERLRQIVHQMPYPVEVFDSKGYAILVNQAFINVFGITLSDLIVGRYNILEDPIMERLGVLEGARKAYQGETVFIPHIIIPITTLDAGKYGIKKRGVLFFEGTMFPVLRSSGEIWQTVLILKDVTERMEVEKELRESERICRIITESATDVIWIIDLDFNLTYISPSVEHLRGFSVQEAMGQTLEETLTPDSLRIVKKALEEELELNKKEPKDLHRSRTLLLEHYCKDGSTLWAEVKSVFLRDSDGNPRAILGISRDASDRKQKEESERKYHQELIDKTEELLDFAHTISHDLKSPLLTIGEYLKILKEDGLVLPEGIKACDKVINLSREMYDFISKLLELSKAGRIVGEYRSVNINKIAEKLFSLLKPADINAELKLPAEPIMIHADPIRIEQVFHNLILNAIYYRDPQKENLIISIDREEMQGVYQFKVEDNGSGIQEDFIKEIFKTGFSTAKRGFGSSGFGLSITRRVIEAHGGKIWAKSPGTGQGTAFLFTIPKR